jgi:PEP-CTERM motif
MLNVGRFLPLRPKVDGQALFNIVSILPAPVAQLDRASDYGSEGLKFESSRARFALIAYSRAIHRRGPGGTRSTFASNKNRPTFLAFQPVPEASTLGLLVVGALGLVWVRRMVKA